VVAQRRESPARIKPAVQPLGLQMQGRDTACAGQLLHMLDERASDPLATRSWDHIDAAQPVAQRREVRL